MGNNTFSAQKLNAEEEGYRIFNHDTGLFEYSRVIIYPMSVEGRIQWRAYDFCHHQWFDGCPKGKVKSIYNDKDELASDVMQCDIRCDKCPFETE